MPLLPDNNQIAWETVGLPLARGVDLRTPGRGIDQQRLLRFENGRFDEADVGICRRRGHEAFVAKGIPSFGFVPPEADDWVYGLGWTIEGDQADLRFAGRLYGMATRDNERLAWDGHQMFSWPAKAFSGKHWQEPSTACMPVARTTPVAKTVATQKTCDLGVGTQVAVVAWIDSLTGFARASVYDAKTWAPVVVNDELDLASPQQVRVVPMGDHVHILVASATTLRLYIVRPDLPVIATNTTDLGNCDTYFDTRKVSDSVWVVLKRDTSNAARLTYLNADGTINTAFCAANTLLDTSPADGFQPVRRVAVAVHPLTGEVGMIYQPNASLDRVYGSVYTPNGVRIGSRDSLLVQSGMTGLTIEAKYEVSADGTRGQFQWFATDHVTTPRTFTATIDAAGAGSQTFRWWGVLTHHAFRIGAKVFVGMRHGYKVSDPAAPRLQNTYFLVDEELKPVGILERGTARSDTGPGLASVHFDDGQDPVNRARFHGHVVYRQRLDSVNNDQFDEESIKLLELDFLPKLRSAQLGRTTYFAGAQLWQYDGRGMFEAGQTVFPEIVDRADSGVAGLPNGTYRYRARWGWKNAQGEEEVSATLTTATIAVASKQIDVTVRTNGFTRKPGAYLLLYRNVTTGTEWFLVTSRDPASASFVSNNTTNSTVTFRDNVSDAALVAFEKDRLDSGAFEPFPAPAAEVIAAGRDRLWLAGGEIPRGDILPSLLYGQGGCAEFNTFTETTVDRGFEPITAIAFMGNSTLVFKPSRVYAFEADGPSNLGVGAFDMPRVIAADTGAVGQEAVVLTTDGVFFQSPAGIQLLATNYQLMDVGQPVSPLAATADIRAALAVPTDGEIRFYTASGPTFVYFTGNNEWGTWTGVEAMGAALDPVTGLAVLARPDGEVWAEREGLWSDAGRGYEMAVRTAWLHRGLLQDYSRVRRVAVLGDVLDDTADTVLQFRTYVDDLPYWVDQWWWKVPAVVSPDGEGPVSPINLLVTNPEWNTDPLATPSAEGLGFNGVLGHESVFYDGLGYKTVQDRRLYDRRRLPNGRQRCSRISVEILDGGTRGGGVGLTEIALELGRRGGLNRMSPRTHTT